MSLIWALRPSSPIFPPKRGKSHDRAKLELQCSRRGLLCLEAGSPLLAAHFARLIETRSRVTSWFGNAMICPGLVSLLATPVMAEPQLRYDYISKTISPEARKTLAAIYEAKAHPQVSGSTRIGSRR